MGLFPSRIQMMDVKAVKEMYLLSECDIGTIPLHGSRHSAQGSKPHPIDSNQTTLVITPH